MNKNKIDFKCNKEENDFLNEYKVGDKFDGLTIVQHMMDENNNLYVAFDFKEVVAKWISMGCPKNSEK